MKFSLKNYIKENYLNERLQSDILIQNILNDKGKMFYYYKIDGNNSFGKLKKTYEELKRIFIDIFENTYSYDENKEYTQRTNVTPTYNKELIDTDEKMIALHNKYMSLYNTYKKMLSKIFDKPDPQVFGAVLSRRSYGGTFYSTSKDLYNITDDQFTKYTYSQLKADKNLYLNIAGELRNKTTFWFSHNNKLLAVSSDGELVLYAIDNDASDVNTYNGKRFPQNVTQDEIIDKVNKDDRVFSSELKDGSILEWPCVISHGFNGKHYNDLYGYDFINTYLNLNTQICRDVKDESIGKNILTKASKIYKTTTWGANPNDYVIIYSPTQMYTDDSHISMYTNTIDNELRRMLTNNHEGYNDYKMKKPNRYGDSYYKEIGIQTYKWTKDILGKYKPYAGSKQNELFAFGKKLSEYDYTLLYKDDQYCNKIAQANRAKYKNLIQTYKSTKVITKYKKDLDDILSQVNDFTQDGKLFCNLIKTTITKDITLFKSLITLYGVYSKILNTVLNQYGKIQKDIQHIKNLISDQSDTHDEYFRSDLKSEVYNVDNEVINIKEVCIELTEIHNKIKEILEE